MAYKIKETPSKTTHVEAEDILSSKDRFLCWVEENRRLVWGGILLTVVVVVAVITLGWLSQKKHEEAWELQGKAQHIYLDRPMDDVKKAQGNIQAASTLFQEIQEKFSGTRGADVSLFLLGNSLMEEQKIPAAIEKYNELIRSSGGDPIFLGLVQQRLGLAYLLNGDRELALSTWQAILDNPKTLNKDQIVFELAKLAESEEKTQEAVGYYKQLMQNYPLSPFANEAGLRVKILAPEEQKEPSQTESKGGSNEKLEGAENVEKGEKITPK
ncbi:MAG: tetratricopeptide repeat protein [Nitrospira sp.]|nr:tetratricopeptide repeat protein [Nitrospira sp.]MCA9474553.1 tetratricopeptide repeat protein [Nitrospira sp.]MCB9711698.1 tetratricopeptide repeat protein [Nitrospiraceae bacterium]